MKKVQIDVNSVVAWYALGHLSGIGRTTMELVKTLDEFSKELPFRIELFSQNMKGIGGRNLNTGFKTRHLWVPHRSQFNKWVTRLRLRELLGNYDLLHIPHNYAQVVHPEKCIVTMHDALFFAYPEEAFHPEFCRKYYTEFARKCRAVLTCSYSSKRDIVEYMGVPEEKVFVAHWGCDTSLFMPTDKKPDKPFFLSTSCDLGRKNTISVIRAFARYAEKSREHDLVLVWRTPPKEILEEVAKLGISNRVRFARNIPESELAMLYGTATAMFFPSLYEGFGLPILEAMACGTPVVTCRNSSLEEVGGEAAIYVEPYDVEAMAENMLAFESMSAEELQRVQNTALMQAAKFTWTTCAQKTIDAYKYALR